MTQSAILTKLGELLDHGVRSEAEAVYLMVEVRKLLEQQNAKKQYQYLTFHCDWALHAKLSGPTAQRVLKLFDAANVHLKAGIKLDQLPGLLRMEIERISKLDYFERELEGFLKNSGIPTLESTRSLMTLRNASATIDSVTLQVQLAKKVEDGDVFFKVRWIIQDKNGKSGEVYVINSFSADPHAQRDESTKTADAS